MIQHLVPHRFPLLCGVLLWAMTPPAAQAQSTPTHRLAPTEDQMVVVAPSEPISRRAAEMVDALNGGAAFDMAAFVASTWALRDGETETDVVALLAELKDKVGQGLTLVRVVRIADGQTEAEVVNNRGRRSLIMINEVTPGKIAFAGLSRFPEREMVFGESVPAAVDLPHGAVVAPLTFVQGRAFVEVMIADKGPFLFQLETGTSGIEVSPHVAAALQGRITPLTDDDLYRHGDVRIDSIYRVSELSIGSARLRDFNIGVQTALNVDGMLGLQAFQDLLLILDYPNKTMTLRRGQLPSTGADIIPLSRTQGNMLSIDVTVGDKAVTAVIDTQSGLGLALSSDQARGIRFQRPPAQVGEVVMGGVARAPISMGRLQDPIRVGHDLFPDQIVQIITHPPHRPRLATLGEQLLRYYRVTLDQKTMVAAFERALDSVPSSPYRSHGFTVTRARDGRFRVASVQAGSEAERVGVKVDDEIVRFDGMDREQLTPKNAMTAQSRFASRAQSPEPVMMTISRNGQTMDVVLTSRVVVE